MHNNIKNVLPIIKVIEKELNTQVNLEYSEKYLGIYITTDNKNWYFVPNGFLNKRNQQTIIDALMPI